MPTRASGDEKKDDPTGAGGGGSAPPAAAAAASTSSGGGGGGGGDPPPHLHPPHYRRASTFSAQLSLPRLPVPTLEETLERFPRSVWALQDSSRREETKRVTDEFLHGDGPALQKLLVDYEEDGRTSGWLGSYVEEFWSEAYLAPNASVVLNLNPFFLLETGPDAKLARDQIGRAASLAFASAKMSSLLRREDLAPDVFRGRPLCMAQFRALFGSCRVPRLNDKDYVEVDPASTHVAVLCRNQFYYFNVLWPDGTVAVDEEDLRCILRAVRDDAATTDAERSVKRALGVLTTLPRKSWAVARDDLISSSEHNAACLEIVDSALFVLVLDDFVPGNIHEAASNMLHGSYNVESGDGVESYQTGTCCNRWYDKLQIIVCGDGSAGVNFEHSAIDGHTALRFASDIFAETVVSFAQSITRLIYGAGSIPDVISAEVRRASSLSDVGGEMCDTCPKRLEFEIPPSVLDRIFFAETALGDEIVSSDTYVLEFRAYGKSFITQNKMSPDSFVQMSMLLAYYVLYGKVVCSYEPVMTKHFYHGRTEAMRPSTPQAAAFCECWSSRFATTEEKLAALRSATKEHSRLVKEAAGGRGVDRHLFALRCIAERNGMNVPTFFESDAWRDLTHTVLSTSNCGNPALRLFGFGPVVPDGFGIGYIIKDGGLQYSISSKHRQTGRYARTLNKVLLDLRGIMKPAAAVTVERTVSGEVGERGGGADSNRRVVGGSSSSPPLTRKDVAVLEYAEGMDYFGELGLDRPLGGNGGGAGGALPRPRPNVPGPAAGSKVQDKGAKLRSYLANVRRRNSSFSEENMSRVGVTISSRNLGASGHGGDPS